MYEKIVDENPYKTPMMIYPAVHYAMGGLWVDYELMSTIPGLFVIGEANFSDHGANRLGASALMQGLADGYFVLPYTLQHYLANQINIPKIATTLPEFEKAEKDTTERIGRLMSVKGTKPVDHFHRELGKIMWEFVGMGRNAEGLKKAIRLIRDVRQEFWKDVRIPGEPIEMNVELEKAGRVADFLELGELLTIDALDRNESCGGHFREEFQTEEGEARRNDDDYMHVSAWEHKGEDMAPELNKENLDYEFIEVKTRNYK
jgi:succinate dehydrogenase / fumarate reductase flavoprotein subunit